MMIFRKFIHQIERRTGSTLKQEAVMKAGGFVFGAGTEFLRAELFAGITRANIAQNARDEGKRQRNCREARKAYDAILYFLPRTFLSQEQKEQIDYKLAELKFALRALGDDV